MDIQPAILLNPNRGINTQGCGLGCFRRVVKWTVILILLAIFVAAVS